MIKATKLHEAFRRNINRVNSSYLKSISVIDVDGYLTEAWFTIYENLVVKSEMNPLADDRIKQKLVRDYLLIPEAYNKDSVKVKYPTEIYRVVRKVAIGCIEGCNSRSLIVHPLQTHNISESLKSDFWKPSFEWEETLCIQDSNGLIVFKDCDMNISEVYIDFYTKPQPIQCPSLVEDNCYATMKSKYIDHEGKIIDTDSDFEMDSTDLWIKVANLAAAKALMNSNDQLDYKNMLESIITDEKLLL